MGFTKDFQRTIVRGCSGVKKWLKYTKRKAINSAVTIWTAMVLPNI